ncbi:lycopene cyclase domain-containing protein [Microbacterium sp.]|uniref:lycopene cyclase domain-containing protein n=1 Tax=Microbacterium sp. TaxID=51671 RepID=UPI0039E503DC
MPGLYLLFLLLSVAGVAALDVRFRLAFPAARARTAITVAVGTVFFLAWDAVGIASGVFVKGSSPLLLGWDLAPHLPVEEPVFLAFLCYLGLVVWHAALRRLRRHRGIDGNTAPPPRTDDRRAP